MKGDCPEVFPFHIRNGGGERGESSTNETVMHKRNEARSKLPGKYQKRSEHLTIHKLLPGRELRLSAGPTCQICAAHVDYTQTIMCRLPISKSIYHRAQRRKSLADDNVQTFHYNHTCEAQIKLRQKIWQDQRRSKLPDKKNLPETQGIITLRHLKKTLKSKNRASKIRGKTGKLAGPIKDRTTGRVKTCGEKRPEKRRNAAMPQGGAPQIFFTIIYIMRKKIIANCHMALRAPFSRLFLPYISSYSCYS